MTTKKKIILADSPEAASIQTVTGWVSSDGHFWGNDERMARYSGSTHRKCEKDEAHGIYNTRAYCKKCREIQMNETWEAMPKIEYSEDVFPLVVFDGDEYFFDSDSLDNYLICNGLDPAAVRLTKCLPAYPEEIDPDDHFQDILPEDGEVPAEVAEAFKVLNAVLKEAKPFCWFPDNKQGVTLPADFLSE